MGGRLRMPATRWLVALGCAALLLVACDQTGGPLIGVRPQAEPSAAPSPAGTDQSQTSAIEAMFAAQLDAINNVQAIGEDALANGQLPIESFLTFRQSLRLAELQTLGES